MARRPAAPSPVSTALERLARLAGAGTSPDRMARETGKIIAEWRADPGLDAGALRERMETMRDDLASGVTSAEEQASDVDQSDKAAVRQADASAKGLRAAWELVAVELRR